DREVVCIIVSETGLAFLAGGRQRDPALQPVQRLAFHAMVCGGALRMGDGAAGAHPGGRAPAGRPAAAAAVAVEQLAGGHVGSRRWGWAGASMPWRARSRAGPM